MVEGGRALDCGAGFGRVTKLLLSEYFDTIDLVDKNLSFLDYAPEDHRRVADRHFNIRYLAECQITKWGKNDFSPKGKLN